MKLLCHWKACLVLIGWIAMNMPATSCTGQELAFHAETRVYVEDVQQPVAEMLTLFDRGHVYDVELPTQKRITFYDPARGRVVLLDVETKRMAKLSSKELIDRMIGLQQQIRQAGKSDVFGIDAQPVAEGNGSYRAGYPGMIYVAETEPEPKTLMARTYSDFTIWAIRLGAIEHPNRAVPFARMALSTKLADDNVLPRMITRTTKDGDKTEIVRSEHVFTSGVSRADRALIDEIGGMLTSFTEVPYADFHNQRVAARQ